MVISIHAPPRGATSNINIPEILLLFQFTPLREGRRRRRSAGRVECYFNSRPSARGDVELSAITGLPYISIHAPPRGATENKNAFLAGIDISIHAPPRGATWSFPPSRDYPTFQFTPLREGRLKTQEFHAMAAISIHAPPRGATLAALAGRRLALLFQFTPLREGRQIVPPPTCRTSSISIHAPPRGATVHRRSSRKPSGDFNSRPSARGDLFRLQRDYHGALISIHAPPRGATHYGCGQGGCFRCISIHAPPRGATKGHGVMMRTVC